jgi:hypothetical protein
MTLCKYDEREIIDFKRLKVQPKIERLFEVMIIDLRMLVIPHIYILEPRWGDSL